MDGWTDGRMDGWMDGCDRWMRRESSVDGYVVNGGIAVEGCTVGEGVSESRVDMYI